MDLTELATIVADLRSEGNDFAEIEVKRASGGFPRSIGPTLSAFANIPGGGTLLFGLDESENFKSVGVYNATDCKSALASFSRQAIDPPINPQICELTFEGKQIIVARV